MQGSNMKESGPGRVRADDFPVIILLFPGKQQAEDILYFCMYTSSRQVKTQQARHKYNRPTLRSIQNIIFNFMSYFSGIFRLVLLMMTFSVGQVQQLMSVFFNPLSLEISTLTTYIISGNIQPQTNISAGTVVTIFFPFNSSFAATKCASAQLNFTTFVSSQCSISSTTTGIQVRYQSMFNNTVIVNSMVFMIQGIQNPNLAKEYSPFKVQIGNNHQNVKIQNLTFKQKQLLNPFITFSDPSVNSISNMQIKFNTSVPIPPQGKIIVVFPFQAKWSKDLSDSHFLNFSNEMSCSWIINNSDIQCNGSQENYTVTLYLNNPNQIANQTLMAFQIHNIFSPPTTQPADDLTINISSPFEGNQYLFSTATTKISDLKPKSLQNFKISNFGNVNSKTNNLTFEFTLPDPINSTDTIEIRFPQDTVVQFNDSAYSGQLSFGGGQFNNSSSILYLNPSHESQNHSAGTNIACSFTNYTGWKNTAPCQICFYFMANSPYQRLFGCQNISATPNDYNISATSSETKVNQVTNVTLNFNLTDQVSDKWMMRINIPQDYKSQNVSFQVTISNSTISNNVINNTNIFQLQLDTTSVIEIPYSITINLYNLNNPLSVSPNRFSIKVYYSTNQIEQVGLALMNQDMVLTSATITINQLSIIDSSGNIASTHQSPVTFAYNASIQNGLQDFLVLKIAPALGNSSQISINIQNSQIQNINITNGSGYTLIQAQTSGMQIDNNDINISVSVSSMQSPPSTAPINTSMSTYFNSSAAFYQEANPVAQSQVFSYTLEKLNQLQRIQISRSNQINHSPSNWTININSSQTLPQGAMAILYLPYQIVDKTDVGGQIKENISLPLQNTGQNYTSITCTLPSNSHSSGYTLVIQGLTNPLSFKPTTVYVSTFDGQYFYSRSPYFINNTEALSFKVMSSQFNNKRYNDTSTANVVVKQLFGDVLTVQAKNMTFVEEGTINISQNPCPPYQTSNQTLISVQQNIVSGEQSYNISISVMQTPPDQQTQAALNISAFEESGVQIYLISSSIIEFSVCDLICRTCQSDDEPGSCTSCFDGKYLSGSSCNEQCEGAFYPNETNFTCDPCHNGCVNCTNITVCISCNNSYYQYQSQCFQSCPAGTYAQTTTNNKTCDKCDETCQNCSQTSTNCTSCNESSFLLGNQCLDKCPNLTYLQAQNKCTKCSQPCKTCENAIDNCTTCIQGNYLHNGTCNTTCPDGFVGVVYNLTCIQGNCPGQTYLENNFCYNCSTNCTSCSSSLICQQCLNGSYLYSVDNETNCTVQCPLQKFYSNDTNGTCMQCPQTCLKCSNNSFCSECDNSNMYNNTCLQKCPDGTTAISQICRQCSERCLTCNQTVDACTSCNSTYYYYLPNECVDSCNTSSITIQGNRTCLPCASPCVQCFSSINNCTSCSDGDILFNNTCYSECPDGYYQSSDTCLQCEHPCGSCTSGTACTTCRDSLLLFNQSCVSLCPSTHPAQVNNVCQSCDSIIELCSNCTQNGQCYACLGTAIFLQKKCYTSCPQGYTYDQTNNSCLSQSSAQTTLANSLSDANTFPMPFSIVGGILFISFFMSKLQNPSTYIIGTAYSFFGILEIGSLIYILSRYYQWNFVTSRLLSELSFGESVRVDNFILLLLVCVCIYLFLNILCLTIQTPLLLNDQKFAAWANRNKTSFIIVTILSAAISYKLRLFHFTKLFSLQCCRAQLENIQKFRLFNILSLIGLAHQGICIYVLAFKLSSISFNNYLFLPLLDTLLITFLCLIFAIVSSRKEDDFFEEEDNGYKLNKKIHLEGEDYFREGLNDEHMQSQSKIQNHIQEEEDFELSISTNRQKERNGHLRENLQTVGNSVININQDQDILFAASTSKQPVMRSRKHSKGIQSERGSNQKLVASVDEANHARLFKLEDSPEKKKLSVSKLRQEEPESMKITVAGTNLENGKVYPENGSADKIQANNSNELQIGKCLSDLGKEAQTGDIKHGEDKQISKVNDEQELEQIQLINNNSKAKGAMKHSESNEEGGVWLQENNNEAKEKDLKEKMAQNNNALGSSKIQPQDQKIQNDGSQKPLPKRAKRVGNLTKPHKAEKKSPKYDKMQLDDQSDGDGSKKQPFIFQLVHEDYKEADSEQFPELTNFQEDNKKSVAELRKKIDNQAQLESSQNEEYMIINERPIEAKKKLKSFRPKHDQELPLGLANMKPSSSRNGSMDYYDSATQKLDRDDSRRAPRMNEGYEPCSSNSLPNTQKSRMYFAGMGQMGIGGTNHPTVELKNRSTSKRRNSFQRPSQPREDSFEFSEAAYAMPMNYERFSGLPRPSTLQMNRENSIPDKPITTARKYPKDRSCDRLANTANQVSRGNNQQKNIEDILYQQDDGNLRQYYGQTNSRLQKSRSRSKSKKKEDNPRVKQMQKIYLQKMDRY